MFNRLRTFRVWTPAYGVDTQFPILHGDIWYPLDLVAGSLSPQFKQMAFSILTLTHGKNFGMGSSMTTILVNT
jgi:hypothetical protein